MDTTRMWEDLWHIATERDINRHYSHYIEVTFTHGTWGNWGDQDKRQ